MESNKRRLRKIYIMILLVLSVIISIEGRVFANDIAKNIQALEYSEEFKEYIELPEEKKEETIIPRMYDIEYKEVQYYNPFKLARIVGSNLLPYYNLLDYIPENVVVRNQEQTNTCWAFATLSSLETNLALNNYNNGISPIAYNFSERHMEYATSRTFKDGVNSGSFKREVGEGGSWNISSAYLTNGTGAIAESQMPFINNENKINLSEIKAKTVTSQVYDTIEFPSSSPTTITQDMINQIKEHIMNNGSIQASIHGAGLFNECYNNETGAIYCDGTAEGCQIDHAVSIIGWKDDYGILNFNKEPSNPGAWIVKNSWGEKIEYNLTDLKEAIFEENKAECISLGYTEPTLIPNEVILENGYKIEGDKAYLSIGKDGIMYVSYEDINIYTELNGIVKASDYLDYENIYQYNNLGYSNAISMPASKLYLGNIFSKSTSGTEYLTQIGLNVLEGCTCKVYVNPNGTSMSKNDLKNPVALKAGTSETLEGAGYHTIEFAEPIKISNNFAVVVEIQGSQIVLLESSGIITTQDGKQTVLWQDVGTVTDKCFVSYDEYFEQNAWMDLGEMSTVNSSLPNGDSTIKAFTTSKVDDNSLKEIKITAKPDKTTYLEGENFDKAGMVVTAYYNNGRSNVIDGYNIENGTNLQAGQSSVTITYENKTVEQPIEVQRNSAVSIHIKTPPIKTEYKAGEDFDRKGMVVEVKFKDGKTRNVTDYTIKNGNNLKNGQTSVTIEFDGQKTTQKITVIPNPLVKIEIQEKPDKTKYVVGQDFEPTGMIVVATYQDGNKKTIKNYTIVDGENLKLGQTEVTIKFEDKTTKQKITVEEKSVSSIKISKMPTKTQYKQNKESLDLAGGKILVKYNDGTEETILMTNKDIKVSGFSNKKSGTIKVTLTYKTKEASFEVTIIEEETAKNSKLDKAKCNVLKVKSYEFTDKTKEQYIIMELEVEDIERNLKNDSVKYYYYLSTNQSENNIENWVKIEENQTNSDKLVFKVNSKDIDNYDELASSNVLYLYIREVAVKGGDQKVAISKSMLVESHVGLEEYLDNVKQDIENSKPNVDTEGDKKDDDKDDTISSEKIPDAGKTLLLIIVVPATICVLLISCKKYKKVKDIK